MTDYVLVAGLGLVVIGIVGVMVMNYRKKTKQNLEIDTKAFVEDVKHETKEAMRNTKNFHKDRSMSWWIKYSIVWTFAVATGGFLIDSSDIKRWFKRHEN